MKKSIISFKNLLIVLALILCKNTWTSNDITMSASPSVTSLGTQITVTINAFVGMGGTLTLDFSVPATASFNGAGISPSGFTIGTNTVQWAGFTVPDESTTVFTIPFTITSGTGMITLSANATIDATPFSTTTDIFIVTGPDQLEVVTQPGVPANFDGTFGGALTPPFTVQEVPPTNRMMVTQSGGGVFTFSPTDVARGGFPLVYRDNTNNMNVTIAAVIPFTDRTQEQTSEKYTNLIVTGRI